MTDDPYSPQYTEEDIRLAGLLEENELLKRGGSVRTRQSLKTTLWDNRTWVLVAVVGIWLWFYLEGWINSFWYVGLAAVLVVLLYKTGRRKEVLIGVPVALISALFIAYIFPSLGSAQGSHVINQVQLFSRAIFYGYLITAIAYMTGWPLIVLSLTGTWVGEWKTVRISSRRIGYPNHKLVPTPTEDLNRRRRLQGMFLTIAIPFGLWLAIISIALVQYWGDQRKVTEWSTGIILGIGLTLLLVGIHLDRSGRIPDHTRFVERPKNDGGAMRRMPPTDAEGADDIDPEEGAEDN